MLKVYGCQQRIVNANQTVSGRVDGIIKIDDVEYILEIKSLKHEIVDDMTRIGMQEVTPYYYDQVQTYMKYARLPQTVFLAISRNTLQVYIEIVYPDEDRGKHISAKIESVISAERIQDIPEEHIVRECHWCPAQAICILLDGKQKFENLRLEKDRETVWYS